MAVLRLHWAPMTIQRREFIGGMATALLANTGRADGSGSPRTTDYYPPAMTGLRGNHKGSFEAMHQLASSGVATAAPSHPPPSDDVDLVIVGGGISGLAAAYFWQQQSGSPQRILILDNHDDFGGHAKRNEFTVNGRTLVGYGGSQSIDTPSHYSAAAKGLLRDLGIEVQRFYDYYDRTFSKRHGMGSRWFFDAAHYGRNALTKNPLGAAWLGVDRPVITAETLADMPLSQSAKSKLLALLSDDRDWLAGRTIEEKVAYLRNKSYEDYLREDLGMPETVVLLMRNRAHGLWAVGYDALSALAAARAGEPGTTSLGLDDWLWGDGANEPYIFHFPDGNAAIARMLVAKLIPAALSYTSMADITSAPLSYANLDSPENSTRLRLNATVVDVRHTGAHNAVLASYTIAGHQYTVRAKHAILACYNHVIPHICPELPQEQVAALQWPEKAPLVYANLALRQWHPFETAGLYHFSALRDFWVYGSLDFPVSMPDYTFSHSPSEPILLHMVHVPTQPGLSVREQYREGRRQLLSLSFDDYERHLRRQLTAMLDGHNFVFDRDVAAITINRWPHGYAYEYVDLWDPNDWGPEKGPHVIARQTRGRIAIANSDSSAYAYVNGAIDAAKRSVDSLLVDFTTG